jgi:DivIVA domain-containing protein
MPLTPAEVHNVAFKKPPIGKRGYDEEEVDAFLDIVEVELSRLIEENNDLRARGGSGAPAPAEADGAPAAAPADDGRLEAATAELNAAREENQRMQGHIGELERALSQGKNGAQQQVVQLQQQLAQTEQQLAESRQQLEGAQRAVAEAQQAAQAAPQPAEPGSPNMEHHAQAVQMLALAQQTADQHMAQSKAEADRLVAEAKSNSDTALTAAQEQARQQLEDAEGRARKLDEDSSARAARTVQEAEQRAATITAQFEQRKAALERRVEELRTFEREYRTRLKSYLESQLRDLDASGNAEPAQNDDMVEAQQG